VAEPRHVLPMPKQHVVARPTVLPMPQQRVVARPMALPMPQQRVVVRLMVLLTAAVANRMVAANTTSRWLLNLAAHGARSGGA
jgi:hypothetical protein